MNIKDEIKYIKKAFSKLSIIKNKNTNESTTMKDGGKKIYFTFVLALILFTVGVCLEFMQYSEKINLGIAEQVVRLHVIANSDKAEDQKLKLEVRDYMLRNIENAMKNDMNVSDCREYVRKNLNDLTKRLQNFVASKGEERNIKILLGDYSFPSKEYKDIDFPAGKYEAVRVIIGEGKGKNWWCVLFPPLCFADAKTGEILPEAKEKLKKQLSEEEYNVITQSRDKIKYRLKFKTIEIFQTSRIRVSEVVDKFIYWIIKTQWK